MHRHWIWCSTRRKGFKDRTSGCGKHSWQSQEEGLLSFTYKELLEVLLTVEWKQRCRRELWSATVNNIVNNLWVMTCLNCCAVWREQCTAYCVSRQYNRHDNLIRDKSSRKSRKFYGVILLDTQKSVGIMPISTVSLFDIKPIPVNIMLFEQIISFFHWNIEWKLNKQANKELLKCHPWNKMFSYDDFPLLLIQVCFSEFAKIFSMWIPPC